MYLGSVRVQPHAQQRVHGLDPGFQALKEGHLRACGVCGWWWRASMSRNDEAGCISSLASAMMLPLRLCLLRQMHHDHTHKPSTPPPLYATDSSLARRRRASGPQRSAFLDTSAVRPSNHFSSLPSLAPASPPPPPPSSLPAPNHNATMVLQFVNLYVLLPVHVPKPRHNFPVLCFMVYLTPLSHHTLRQAHGASK